MKALATAIGRRGLLRLLGGAAAAAPALGSRTPGASINHFMNQAPAGALIAPVSAGSTTQENPLKQMARKTFWKTQEEREARLWYRMGGWDVDIHAMRSWSPAFRRAVQMQRDADARSFLERFAKSLGLED